MMETCKISADIDSTDYMAQLGLEIWLNDTQIYNSEWIQNKIVFCYYFESDDAEHRLSFVMKNKVPEHTEIDSQGNIVKDAMLVISNLQFDDIALGNSFAELAKYQHNFNGTGQTVVEKCFGPVGCNGTVSMEFSTPVYLWLLENI